MQGGAGGVGGGVSLCFYSCQVRLQLKFHHSSPLGYINYTLKPETSISASTAASGWKKILNIISKLPHY